MKKERDERPRKKLSKQKKAITIVMFMSKESYCKVWDGVKLTAENKMLFYLPRMVEGWTESRFSLMNLGRNYSHLWWRGMLCWHNQRIVEGWEKVVKNQNILRQLTGLIKLKIKNKKKGRVRRKWSGGVKGRYWQTDTTEPAPPCKHREVSVWTNQNGETLSYPWWP